MPLDARHYFASFGLCIHISHCRLPYDISGELLSTSMYFIVTLAAQYYEILSNIGSACDMFLDMVKLEDSRIFASPLFPAPPTKATRIIVSFVDCFLNFERYAAVVRLSDSIFTLKNILTHP
jgi:hypothetical protein